MKSLLTTLNVVFMLFGLHAQTVIAIDANDNLVAITMANYTAGLHQNLRTIVETADGGYALAPFLIVAETKYLTVTGETTQGFTRPTIPVLSTPVASSITSSSFIIDVAASNYTNIITQWQGYVRYSRRPYPSTTNTSTNSATSGTTVGSRAMTQSGLTASTQYRCRARWVSLSGAYLGSLSGETGSITTLP